MAIPPSPDRRRQIALTICARIGEGMNAGAAVRAAGIDWASWQEWRANDPALAAAYAEALHHYAEHLVLACPVIAADQELAPAARRVMIDAHLRVAALLCPRRFSQSVRDRQAAPPPDETDRPTPEQIATTLVRVLGVANRTALPQPIPADFDEIPE